MSEKNNPILSKEKFDRWHHLWSPPVPEPGVAIVIFRAGQPPYMTLTTGQRPSAGQLIGGHLKAIYMVDVTEHAFSFNCSLPCKGDAFKFDAEVQVTYHVMDPAIIVDRNIIDVRTVLEPLLINAMRNISRKYEVEQSADAECDIAKMMKGASGSGFKVDRLLVKLELDDDARNHIRKLKELERIKERENKATELTKQRDQIEMERMQTKMDFYSPLIREGQWNLLALQLANRPEDAVAVMQWLSQQNHADTNNMLQALKVMLDNDVLEGFQLQESGKKLLQFFERHINREYDRQLPESSERTKMLSKGEDQRLVKQEAKKAESVTVKKRSTPDFPHDNDGIVK
jgi:hypothetical protein